MTIREDALRALEYGKTPYYNAIRTVPSYQAELARVQTDYNERTWIDFSGFLPKFTTADFEKRRTVYQAKYGSTVNVPGFSDVIHIIPRARISSEERAAHIWAIKRGLPSPLTPQQIETMQYKKFRFLKALSSATPTWMKNYGAVATVLDNVEDSLITVVVAGRIAAKIAPRLLSRLVPGLGWVLMGSDVLNAVNLISWAGAMRGGCKGLHGEMMSKNAYHAKAAARRTLKLTRAIPTFGEALEVLQTTDQLFGVGVCLGGLVGMVVDAASKALNPEYWSEINRLIVYGTVKDVAAASAKAGVADYKYITRSLGELDESLKNESARIGAAYFGLQEKVHDWFIEKIKKPWDWVVVPPEEGMMDYPNALIGEMIMSTGKDDFLKEDHTKAFMMLNTAIQGVMPWWFENDPLENFKGLREFSFRVPRPRDSTTIDMLNDYNPQWENTLKWPHLDKEYATIEEITMAYAPMIKDSFQTYCLKYRHEWEAYVAASQAVDFVQSVIKAFDDNHEVRIGYTAWVAAAIDMMDQRYIMPPDTPRETIEAFADYIGNYERQTAGPVPIKDLARYGESIGIEWMRTFPSRAFWAAAEIFPECQTIQDQLDELFVAD